MGDNTRSGATRTPEGARVVVSVASNTLDGDELSELVADLLLHAEAVCIRLKMRRRAIERLREKIREHWNDEESEAACGARKSG